MKRVLSLSFLLFANMVVLAHVVIPHHYHDQIPDISWSFWHKRTDSKENQNPTNQCPYPNCPFHGIIEDCLLKKIYFRLDNDNMAITAGDSNVVYPMPFFSISPMDDFIYAEGLPFNIKSYLLSNYTDYITHSLGLRAPPFR